MSKFTILLALTALASDVVLSGSVDYLGNHQILSSGTWKTNLHNKKSFGSTFPSILLPSNSLDEVFTPNLLNLTKEDIHQKIAFPSQQKSTPFSGHAESKILKSFRPFGNLAKLFKSKLINQPFIPSFHQQQTKPFQKTSENINLKTDGHAKRIAENSEFVDFDKYVSFGKPYKSTGTSTIDSDFQPSISNILPSIDNLDKIISATKAYKNSDSATSANFKLDETTESIEIVNPSSLDILNKYVTFGKPYQSRESSTSFVLRFDGTTELPELVNYSDQVDLDKYVSFGKPYKNGENINADNISKLGLESQLFAIDDTTDANASVPKTSTTVIIPYDESSFIGTSRNNASSSDWSIPEDTKDVVPSNTHIGFPKNNSNVMSGNAHEALGLPIAFQLPIEEHNFLEKTEVQISITKCERLEGKPIVVCVNENSKNISTITFDAPSKDSSIIAVLITNALFKSNDNLTDTKALQGSNELLNETLAATTFDDTPKKESNFSNDAKSKYLDSNLSDARSKAPLNEQLLAANVSIHEENITNRFIAWNNKFEGYQIKKLDELLKYESLINAGNYKSNSNEEGSGEAP